MKHVFYYYIGEETETQTCLTTVPTQMWAKSSRCRAESREFGGLVSNNKLVRHIRAVFLTVPAKLPTIADAPPFVGLKKTNRRTLWSIVSTLKLRTQPTWKAKAAG